MSENSNYLYATDSQMMQLSYEQFTEPQKSLEEARRLQEVTERITADLQRVLGGIAIESHPQPEQGAFPDEPTAVPDEVPEENSPAAEEAATVSSEKVSLEFSAGETDQADPAGDEKNRTDAVSVPPVKADIAEHFNQQDESGRVFSLFKQYYTCLNESCGGTVRVTMKDGVCSLWNYDEWEEFAFVDIYEGKLRIALDPRYTDELKALQLCEVPRLLAKRRNVICVQIDNLNNTLLEVLVRAFTEIGMQTN